MATGKKAKTPEKYEPIELLAAVTTITQNHHAGTPGKIGARHLDTFDRAGNAIAARGQNGERVDHRVQYDGAGGAPIHEPQQKHGDKPDQKCAAKAEPQRVLLRQRGIAEREQRAGGIGDQAADRALRDELRRMLERKNDHGRAAGCRQRGDQRSDERPAALDD
ncbi:MAG TPA: hypothetical protein VI137_05645, partial [Pseudolabrys sp.]